MAEEDRDHWDAEYGSKRKPPRLQPVGLPSVFLPYQQMFPTAGAALDLACGRGQASVWLAERGLDVFGVDVSPVAVGAARDLAAHTGVTGRCRFAVHDLDRGLPEGPLVDVVLCNLFRDPRLYRPIRERLLPGGLLAISVLSEVGHGPGRFRAPPGELIRAFGSMTVVAEAESGGTGWLLARA